MKKQLLSILLCLCMVFSMMPMSALATDVEPPIGDSGVTQVQDSDEPIEGETSVAPNDGEETSVAPNDGEETSTAPVCTCTEKCSEENVNSACEVCKNGFDQCEFAEASAAPTEKTAYETVVALFEALPSADSITADTTAEEKEAIMAQLEAAMAAYYELTDDEQAQFETEHSDLLAAEVALNNAITGNVPMLLESSTQTADFTLNNDGSYALSVLNTYKTGDTKSVWDSERKILTLNGVNFSTTAACALKLPANTTINLAEGTTNTITTIAASGAPCAISASANEATGEFTITGSGTLTASAMNDGSSAIGQAISCTGSGELLIDGATVKAYGGDYGIYSESGAVCLKDATVTATATNTGAISGASVSIDNSNVNASGKAAILGGSGGITIMDSTVKAMGVEKGLYSSSSVTIGGTSDVTAQAALTGSAAIIGTLTATDAIIKAGTNSTGTDTTYTNQQWVNLSFANSLSFDARNGATIEATRINDSMTLPADPTWGDYTFAGWFTGIDGTGTVVDLAAAKALIASTKVYAQWTKDGKTVRTEALNLNSAASDQSDDKQGWSWNNTSKTLTLSGVTVNTSADTKNGMGIRVPADTTVELADGTTNTVNSGIVQMIPSDPDGISTLSAGLASFADSILVTGASPNNITIVGNGTLNIKSADIKTSGDPAVRDFLKTYGIYASITVGSGTDSPNVNATGGNVEDQSTNKLTVSFGVFGDTVMQSGNLNVVGGKRVDCAEGRGVSAGTGVVTAMTGGTLTATGENDWGGLVSNIAGIVVAGSADYNAATLEAATIKQIKVGSSYYAWVVALTSAPSKEVLTVKMSFPPAVTVSGTDENKTAVYGVSNTKTFSVENIVNTNNVHAEWCKANGSSYGESAGGLSLGTIENGKATLTLTPVSGATTSRLANVGDYYFRIIDGNVKSNIIKYTITQATATLEVSVSPANAKPNDVVTITAIAQNGNEPTEFGIPYQIYFTNAVGTDFPLARNYSTSEYGAWTVDYIIPPDVLAGPLTLPVKIMDDSGNYIIPPAKNVVVNVTNTSTVNMTLTPSKTASIYGDSVKYSVALAKSAQDEPKYLDGTVKFYLGDAATGELLATKTIGTNELSVTLDYTKLTNGSHTITAVYSGNSSFDSATKSCTTSVAPKTLTWDTSSLSSSKKFDGTKDAAITGELKLSGTVGTDDAGFSYDSITAAYEDADAGENKTITVTVVGSKLTNDNYLLPSSANLPSFKGTITEVNKLDNQNQTDPQGRELKLEMQSGLSDVPAALQSNENLNTTEKIMNQLKTSVTQTLGSGDSVELTYLDIILWVREDGGTWKKADPANFPAGGITVLIPYSELSTTYEQAQHINFSVAHMFAVTANGNTAGNIETPTCNVTANGLQFTVAGLSPIAVGRSAKSLITYNANGGICDTASAYAEGNGKLSNLPTPAKSGSYRFDGWFTAAVGGTAVTADTVFAEDTTVYAHWTYTGSGDNEDSSSSSDEDSSSSDEDSSSSDDGDSSYSYYTITATAGEGGTISTDKTVSVREGNNASFTFTPNNGYQIADVLVNGKSVGAVKTFTFTNVRSNQTIHVTFKASTGHVNSQTGDTGNMSLWIALLFISGGLLTTIGINKKRKNTTNK